MTPESEELHSTFTAAFPGYLRARIELRGLPQVEDAVAVATEWFEVHLRSLLEQPATEQVQSPLEVLRDALAIPTEALQRLRATPVDRDEAEAGLLPADPYGLVPASPQELGEAAWRAHIAWGVAKAREVAGMVPGAAAPKVPPQRATIAVVTTDLMDRTRLSSIVQGAGFDVAVLRNPGAVQDQLEEHRPSLAFVDLGHGAADEVIAMLAGAGVKVVAYGPHVDDMAMMRARSLGAADAVPRSRFFRDPGGYLPAVT